MATIDLSGNTVTADTFTGNLSATTVTIGGTPITATAAELNYVDASIGTAAASKALILDASKELDWAVTSAAAALVEPLNFDVTLTGAGATGGHARFSLTANVSLGSTSDALRAEMTFGASGISTGVAGALAAELHLEAGTTSGSYAPLLIELDLPSGASTGTRSSFIYATSTGADVATFDTNGYIVNLQGLTAGASKVFQTGLTAATVNGNCTAALRVRVGSTDYFIPLATATT